MGLFGKSDPAKLRAKGDAKGLIALLVDEDVATRVAAAEALGELRDDRAIGPLSNVVLHDPFIDKALPIEDMQRWPVSAAAARALAAIGAHAVDPLMAAAKDPNGKAKPRAFLALGLLRWQPALEELTRQRDEIKTTLAKHEEQMSWSPKEGDPLDSQLGALMQSPKAQEMFRVLKEIEILKQEAASWAIRKIRGEDAS